MKKTFLMPLLLSAAVYCNGDEGEDTNTEFALLEPGLRYNNLLSQQDYIAPIEPVFPAHKIPVLAACLSTVIPGLGQAYVGDYKVAAGLFGTVAVSRGLGSFDNLKESYRSGGALTGMNVSYYSIYGAYRDARAFNSDVGYSYKMPTEGLGQLVLAPFRWSVIKKAEVWGGVLGAIALATGVQYFLYHGDMDASLSISEKPIYPLLAFPVGIGEESLFRGFLQSSLSEVFTPWGGIILSSLCFGAAHLTNTIGMDHDEKRRYYTTSIPLITSFGVYCGWLTYKNQSLKESVAVHAWYDFVVFLASYSVAQSAALKKPTVGFSCSF